MLKNKKQTLPLFTLLNPRNHESIYPFQGDLQRAGENLCNITALTMKYYTSILG